MLETSHRGGATEPRHPAQDGLADTEPILGNLSEFEARTVVAHEALHPLGADLDIDGHRRGAMADRVEQRLPKRPHEGCPALVQGAVTGHHQLDGDAVEVLDLVRNLRHRGGQAGLRADRAGIQPAAQLTLLGTGEADNLGGVGGLPLDQGQRLQDGVMQVRGDLCPLGLPDPLCLLGAQVSPQAHPPGGRDEGSADQHRHSCDPHIPQPGQAPALGRQHDDPHRGQGDPDPQAYQAGPPAAGTQVPDQPSAALGLIELGPGEHRPAGHGQQRDEHAKTQVEAVLLSEEHRPDEKQPEPDDEVAHRLVGRWTRRHDVLPGNRGGLQRLRRQRPQEQVGHDTGAAPQRGQDERQPHVTHLESEVLGQPRAHPGQVAALDRTLHPGHRPARNGAQRLLLR